MAFFLEGPVMERMQRRQRTAVQEQKHYACDICSVTFSDEQEFSDHAKTHRRTQPRKQKSTRRVTRSKTFNQTIDNVISHLQLEREETTQVQNNFSSARGKKHKSCHGNNPEQMETESEAKSYRKEELKKQVEAHRQDTHHTCTKCDMQFSDEDTLACHMMVHDNNTTERPDDNSITALNVERPSHWKEPWREIKMLCHRDVRSVTWKRICWPTPKTHSNV